MKKHINRLGVRTASAVAAMVLVANAAWALEPFKVQDIRVEGLQRVEPGTIFASMPLRVGDDYNDEKGAAAIRALFGLGLFKDVRWRPLVTCWSSWSKSVPPLPMSNLRAPRSSTRRLKKSMRDVGLTEGRPYDKALADRAEQELKRQYINKSLYG
jgi:outer membrane protein insertion porin family